MKRLVAGLLVAGLIAAGLALAQEKRAARVALPTVKIEKGDACVAPVAEMRRDHMKMLMHQRDRTVHLGIRTAQHSLKGCIECHASPGTGSVLGKDGFCSSCHTYASVSIDCFECHTPLRRSRAASSR